MRLLGELNIIGKEQTLSTYHKFRIESNSILPNLETLFLCNFLIVAF